MGQFAVEVADYMVQPVETVGENESLGAADKKLLALGVSALPVLDAQGRGCGVISRTDLLKAGRVRVDDGTRKRALSLPDAKVREFMNSTTEVVTPSTPLWEAAGRMVRNHYHRLFVAEDSRLIGVIGTKEMMRAVADVKVAAPIKQIMSTPVIAVKTDDPLSLAIDRMAAAHRSGLVVIQGDWPVGIFTQEEALAARDDDPKTPVSEWMDMRILAIPCTMPIFLAAAQALATNARRILPLEALGTAGIVTGMDFTQLVARSHND